MDRLPAIEPDALDLLSAVRDLVTSLGSHALHVQMQPEAAKGAAARTALDSLFPAGVQPLVAAHDALAAALNAARPGQTPLISLTTERQA